jgi:hypothetical protein
LHDADALIDYKKCQMVMHCEKEPVIVPCQMQVKIEKEVKVEIEDEDSDEDSEDEESDDDNEAYAVYTIFTHNGEVREEIFADYNGIYINGQHTSWVIYDRLKEQSLRQSPK